MAPERYAPRLLGGAFLAVVVTSLGSGIMRSSAMGSGSTSDILVTVSKHTTLVRLSVLADMLTSVGVIVLAVLLYVVLRDQSPVAALIAFGCWLTEAMALAMAKVGTLALIPLGRDFVQAGAPANSYYLSLGDFFYAGVDQQLGAVTHMLFYCVGGLIWYSLIFRSRFVPRLIPAYGVAAVALGLVGIVVDLLGYSAPIWFFLPVLPFEVAIGAWLALRGIDQRARAPIGRARLAGAD